MHRHLAWACSLLLLAPHLCNAQITVHHQAAFFSTTTTAEETAATVPAAYNTTELIPPALPNPLPATAFTINVENSAASVSGLSIPQRGTFYGFSIEMSVINQVLGKNSSFIQVPFLNLMSNIVQRAGEVHVRVGGNTQEYAVFTDQELENGRILEKENADTDNPTATPATRFTIDVFYLLSNITSLVNVKWYLGIPFNDTATWRLEMAEYGQRILGDNLLALQAGNEPDLYASHNHRPVEYGPSDYLAEVQSLISALQNDPNIEYKQNLLGPSIATGDWTPDMVWEAGFIESVGSDMYALTVEHYPDNNCFATFGVGRPKFAQEQFPDYLNHTSGQLLCQPYLDSAARAQAIGKPLLMFETNSASCGGFPGISDSYGGALWVLDYGLQMAYSNFSEALLHVGGQNVFYNPFTAPPTKLSASRQWTVGAIYYSVLVMSEIMGNTNTARIIDLQQPYDGSASIFTPQYAVYENDVLTKIVLFNYMDDDSGASDLNVGITLNGATVPAQVSVKYLEADSVSTVKEITWAGQTFGGNFESDGRLNGTLNIVTIDCDQAANTCTIPVAAPGFAVVFMNNEALTMTEEVSTATYTTSVVTAVKNTATIDPAVLATSNGMSGSDWDAAIDEVGLGSSSYGSVERDWGTKVTASFSAFLVFLLTACAILAR